MKRQKDAFTDSVMKANHSLEIADWQKKFDEERWEERLHQRITKLGGGNFCFSVDVGHGLLVVLAKSQKPELPT
jgi:putative component of toxin-antitoxin plasmid stabilization module